MNLPKSWADVKLKQLPDINDAQAFEGDAPDKLNRLLAALTGEHLDVIESLPISEAYKMIGQLDWIQELPTKVVNSFELKGVKYNLLTNPYKATTGQYAALTEYIKKDGFYKVAECAAVMCIPEGSTYKSSEIQDRAQLFWDELSVDIIYPYTGFFLTLLEKSWPLIQLSIQNKTKEAIQAVNETLMEVRES